MPKSHFSVICPNAIRFLVQHLFTSLLCTKLFCAQYFPLRPKVEKHPLLINGLFETEAATFT